ncbi:MAG: hypothetical protein IT436_09065 [Phycisphaerales bacterium]|nr:hypothetical protein [Phycisphaerales bacterium]
MLLMLLAGGCADRASQPMSTALFEVTGESGVLEVKAGLLDSGTIMEHHVAISLPGMLPVADVGQQFHFPAKSAPTAAIGAAVLQSYRLIGETCAPAQCQVMRVRELIDEVQARQIEVAAGRIEISRLRTQLESIGGGRGSDKPGLAAADAMAGLVSSVREDLDCRVRRQATTEILLSDSLAKLREAAATPGILIARWSAERGGRVSVQGSGLSAGVSERTGRGGYVVLGGLRVVSLVFGEDFWHLLSNLREHEREYVCKFGVSSLLVQSKYVAYTSGISDEVVASLNLAATSDAFDMETASLTLTLAQLGQYSNSAALGSMKWKREPFCFVCGLDLPQLALRNEDRVLQSAFGCDSLHAYRGETPDGWRTLAAHITYPRSSLIGSRVWEAYNKARCMHGAPTCPLCRNRSAHVDGVPQGTSKQQPESAK